MYVGSFTAKGWSLGPCMVTARLLLIGCCTRLPEWKQTLPQCGMCKSAAAPPFEPRTDCTPAFDSRLLYHTIGAPRQCRQCITPPGLTSRGGDSSCRLKCRKQAALASVRPSKQKAFGLHICIMFIIIIISSSSINPCPYFRQPQALHIAHFIPSPTPYKQQHAPDSTLPRRPALPPRFQRADMASTLEGSDPGTGSNHNPCL
jgi:hypothetical protein